MYKMTYTFLEFIELRRIPSESLLYFFIFIFSANKFYDMCNFSCDRSKIVIWKTFLMNGTEITHNFI